MSDGLQVISWKVLKLKGWKVYLKYAKKLPALDKEGLGAVDCTTAIKIRMMDIQHLTIEHL